MMIKIATCLLTLGFLTACETTKTTKRETLREMNARYASNTNASEPAAPAEGPADVSADHPTDPALVPTPLFQAKAIGNP